MTHTASISLDQSLSRDGFAMLPGAVDAPTIEQLIADTAAAFDSASGQRGGIRHILRDFASVRALARHPIVRMVAEAAVGQGACAVRGILFDKTPDANWKVIWHQDLTIAVRERREIAGFGPWTEKDGVPHVQPPAELLAKMVAVRIHLDDCTDMNGPVRVIPESHRYGRLTPTQIDQWKASGSEVVCTVARGGILAFHSLLLHASSPAQVPAHRRVIHLEFVANSWKTLPSGLEWYELH